jgi:hypothetical protein
MMDITELSSYRLILTASSGRCGTQLLSNLLNLVPGVISEHEPPPRIDNVWWRLRNDPTLAGKWLNKYKLPSILNKLKNSDYTVYCETSHMLCKGFFEPMLDLGYPFDLIILSRDLRATAMSFYSLNDIPARSKTGVRWLLHPDDIGCISQLPTDRDALTDYQMCYWYVLEMELRKAYYRKVWEDAGQLVVAVALEDLTDRTGFGRLLSEAQLPGLNRAQWIEYRHEVSTKCNEKLVRKSFMRSRGLAQKVVADIEKQELTIREMIKYDNLLKSVR